MSIEKNLPTLSFIIPTLNSERTIEECLKSIELQDYPKDKLEVVIADAGSTDSTMEIVRGFERLSTVSYKIVANELKTGEAGKAIGIDVSCGNILAFVDSDNVLVGADWLKKMVAPFQDKEIFASEVLYWEYSRVDSAVDRYCALTGINDPICLSLGNYDRWSLLTNRWTDLEVMRETDKGEYLKIFLKVNNVPTMGANGFLIRKDVLKSVNYKPYYFDSDIIFELVKKGYTIIARPKIGIRHYFCDNVWTYVRKQKRRIDDYLYFKTKKMRTFEYKIKSYKFVKFIVYTLLIFPLLFQSIRGFAKRKDSAWFFHPVACWITLIVYSFAFVRSFVDPKMLNREKWRQ